MDAGNKTEKGTRNIQVERRESSYGTAPTAARRSKLLACLLARQTKRIAVDENEEKSAKREETDKESLPRESLPS